MIDLGRMSPEAMDTAMTLLVEDMGQRLTEREEARGKASTSLIDGKRSGRWGI